MKKKSSFNRVTLSIGCRILLVMFFSGLFLVCQAQEFAGGDGTVDDPWQVETAEHLNNVRNYLSAAHQDKHFVQTANIDLGVPPWNEGEGWEPIIEVITQYEIVGFHGTYNGDHHVIDGLYINRPGNANQALFGAIHGADISNLGLTNVNISGAGATGALSGSVSGSTIDNCYSTGYISGSSAVGGLIGSSGNSLITNSYSTCNVSATAWPETYVGGFIGINGLNNSVIGCYSMGNVTSAGWRAGGFAGTSNENSLIENCYSTGNLIVGDGTCIGGLVGNVDRAVIRNSYYNYEEALINGASIITIGALDVYTFTDWMVNNFSLDIDDYLISDGTHYLINDYQDLRRLLFFGQFEEYSFRLTSNINLMHNPDFYIPYFVGDFDGNDLIIENMYLNLPGISRIGMFGYTYNANISNLGLLNAHVAGNMYAGSVVGHSQASVIDGCHASGSVNGTRYVGGLVGQGARNTEIINSFNYTDVNGQTHEAGGIAGQITYQSSISNCYNGGTIQGNFTVGGIVGNIANGCSVSKCFNIGEVHGTNNDVGGVAGTNFGNLNNSFNRGDISSLGNNLGGLVGRNTNFIELTYSTGPVSGTGDYIGGLVGRNNNTVSSSYWDIETSGQTTSAGGSARNTAEMTHPYTGNMYWNWNFSTIWTHDTEHIVNDGYPYLRGFIHPYPYIAVNPLPESGSIDIPITLSQIGWSYQSYANFTPPAGFRVYMNTTGEFQEDDDFVWKPYEDGVVLYNCSEILPDLQYNTIYYWKVVPTTVDPYERGYGDTRVTGLRADAPNCPVWNFTTEIETSVEDINTPFLTQLIGNYPNPFNPDTVIEFSLAADSRVSLIIYNILGQRVKTLAEDHFNKGYHQINWDGTNDQGKPVPSGVYLYRIITEDHRQTKRMMLLK